MKIGFIGSGNIGRTVASCFLRAGHSVVMSNSRGPETLTDLVRKLGSKATAATAEQAALADDLIVVTVPLYALPELSTSGTKDKVIIDTMNYYPLRDGHIASLDNGTTTTSELTAAHFPNAHVVKAFNSIIASEIETTAKPKNDPKRRALPIAGDSAKAKETVTDLIEAIGFDVYDAGDLHEGFRFQNGTPAYCARADRSTLVDLLQQV
ncbi:NAD(P)-binding domain-containing protein [Sporolactobacillus shoreicorticis]|uniref:NADPH-dependent F420 reductase n=1 Tax=Sporolactobacillus shoreicorticis TaxID=1923877 RepID=A0ABW5S3H0_9BACL|nr:NAD(P)-binding domain-containing protein [Sporolactobacillus shoreicorticis]MCO7127051.1 NAD(P)-binding domain-containing protein [Sporolactobacillus shoreicorticis]